METTGLDRISYALGLSMGNNFKASGIHCRGITYAPTV